VTGAGLAKRIFWVVAGAFTFLLFTALVRSEATPIRPDVTKLLAQPQEQMGFPLARASWNGSETPATPEVSRNPTLERLGPAASVRETHKSLKTAAIPDFRAVAGILLCILLLRRIRSESITPHAKKDVPAEQDPEEFSRAA
jgi:hypothetical protein